jgi:hypothetical protein
MPAFVVLPPSTKYALFNDLKSDVKNIVFAVADGPDNSM